MNPDPGDMATELTPLVILDGVVRLPVCAGQVLVHRGHVPLGLFLLFDGNWLVGQGPTARQVRAGGLHGAWLVPGLPELELPAERAVCAISPAQVLVLPRSLCLGDDHLQTRLRDLNLPTVSLRIEPSTTGVQP